MFSLSYVGEGLRLRVLFRLVLIVLAQSVIQVDSLQSTTADNIHTRYPYLLGRPGADDEGAGLVLERCARCSPFVVPHGRPNMLKGTLHKCYQ